jgi:hypothetical protein
MTTTRRDAATACRVGDEFLIEGLEFDAPVRIWHAPRAEPGRLHENEVLEGSRCSLGACVHTMPHRPALHRDNRMMAILAGHGG